MTSFDHIYDGMELRIKLIEKYVKEIQAECNSLKLQLDVAFEKNEYLLKQNEALTKNRTPDRAW